MDTSSIGLIYTLFVWWVAYAEEDCSCFESEWKCGDIESTNEHYNTCVEDHDAYLDRTSCRYCCAVDDTDSLCFCKDSDSECDEVAATSWIWWGVSALVIFLVMLCFLVYKYWWKQRLINNALKDAENDLDCVIDDEEQGFGHDLHDETVGFNPMATKVNIAMR
eukprot:587443_1